MTTKEDIEKRRYQIANTQNIKCHFCGAATGMKWADTKKGVVILKIKDGKYKGKYICTRCKDNG